MLPKNEYESQRYLLDCWWKKWSRQDGSCPDITREASVTSWTKPKGIILSNRAATKHLNLYVCELGVTFGLAHVRKLRLTSPISQISLPSEMVSSHCSRKPAHLSSWASTVADSSVSWFKYFHSLYKKHHTRILFCRGLPISIQIELKSLLIRSCLILAVMSLFM